MNKTLSDQLVEALVLRGWTEGPKQSRHRTFTHPEKKERMLVGEAGGLRYGSNHENSISLTGKRFYKELLDTANLPSVDLKL